LHASGLRLPLVRFLPPEDERVRNTVLAVASELTMDGLVLRYRVEETDDGFADEEGTFTICSFWLVSALSEIGEPKMARDLCEKLLGYASPLHLYAEEIDPRSGRHFGNFPQAFTHLALAGGSTPRRCHELLVEQEIDWSRMHLWESDERCVPPDDPESNFLMIRESLLHAIAIPGENVHRVMGERGPDAAADAYE